MSFHVTDLPAINQHTVKPIRPIRVEIGGLEVQTYHRFLARQISQTFGRYTRAAAEEPIHGKRLNSKRLEGFHIAMGVFARATRYTWEQLQQQPLMTTASYSRALSNLQDKIWREVVLTHALDCRFTTREIPSDGLDLRARLLIDVYLPAALADQYERDLRVLRKYVLAWFRLHAAHLTSTAELICQSNRPWLGFAGVPWLRELGLETSRAQRLIEKFNRRSLLLPFNQSGRNRIYHLDLKQMSVTRDEADVSSTDPSFEEFQYQQKVCERHLVSGPQNNHVIRNSSEVTGPYADPLVNEVLDKLLQHLKHEPDGSMTRSVLDAVIRHLDQNQKYTRGIRFPKVPPRLQSLCQPLIERRLLVQVLLPLIFGFQGPLRSDEFMQHVETTIAEAYRSAHLRVGSYLESLSDYQLEPSRELSRRDTEQLVATFSVLRGDRQKMLRLATIAGYMDWQKSPDSTYTTGDRKRNQ